MKLIRLPVLDTLRGLAMIAMAVYHLCFDLNQFGVLHENMNFDPFWLHFRALIMTSFLSLVGIGLFLGRHSSHSGRRLLKIGGAATLISISTYFINSDTWIYFGILHLIFLASLIGPLLVTMPKRSLAVGIFLIALPLFYRDMWFDQPFLILSGLSPIKPNTEDFAPLAPWLGVVLIGIFLGSRLATKKMRWTDLEIRPLSQLGKHSLIFYMTHQLILYPLAWMISKAL